MPFLHERKSFILRSRQIENTAKRNGLRHTIFNTIGDQYIGEWKDDKKSGKGKIITRAGELYEGDLEGNRRHGFGVLARKLPNRDVFELIYRGDWKNGKMSGTGLRIFPDGGFYVGGWKNGKREGHGRHWYSDGAFYDGQYKNDMRHGLGILIKADGNGYEGAFKSDKKRGKARLEISDIGSVLLILHLILSHHICMHVPKYGSGMSLWECEGLGLLRVTKRNPSEVRLRLDLHTNLPKLNTGLCEILTYFDK
ncbi:MORN repeat-containing protein 3-like isoform X5 [Cylas formicarius]|uniref:MORN repeat-containing protein 3-like isoform X5 n=1 Tax=Cylas formicarius TaxID=197179 RepID=UPI002958D1E3|nr:MORN repeat-containing protein 3-like isoform X5 [Cylas formicarius]